MSLAKYPPVLTGLITISVVLTGLIAFDYWREYSGPRIAISPDNVEVTVGEKEDSTHVRVNVANKGQKPLTINKIRTSCGCTKAAISRSRLQPNDTAELDLSISLPGERHKTILVLVESNDPVNAQKVINVVARRSVEAFAVPTSVEFGIVRRSDLPAKGLIHIHTQHPEDPAEITVRCPNSSFEIAGLRRVAANEQVFAITVLKKATSGYSEAPITVSDALGKFELTIWASVRIVD